MKNIVLTGGGTAGHVIPNLALIPLLKDAGYRIHYIGSKDGIEKSLIKRNKDVVYHEISSGKLRRYFSFKNFVDPFKILAGLAKSVSLIKKIKPDVCFSKGGFVSVPVVIACAMQKIPVVIHESDMTPGLANRISRPYCKVMCTTFDEAAKLAGDKGVVTGSPVRPEILNGDKLRGMIICGYEKGRPTLLIMGGSTGAQSLNEKVDEILDKLIDRFQIIHIRGTDNIREDLENKAGYRQFGYINDELPHIMASADVVLSRAGANAIFEFAALNKPMLLVPLPLSASRGDQIKNAEYFKQKGWAHVIDQDEMSGNDLYDALLKTHECRRQLENNLKEADMSNGLYKLYQQIMIASK